jgi:hypothetical protein
LEIEHIEVAKDKLHVTLGGTFGHVEAILVIARLVYALNYIIDGFHDAANVDSGGVHHTLVFV